MNFGKQRVPEEYYSKQHLELAKVFKSAYNWCGDIVCLQTTV